MKLSTMVASVVVCSVMAVSHAVAHTTIFGSTGMVINPTAGVMPQGQTSVQGSYLREKPNGFRLRGLSLSGATGITPRAELSLGWQDMKVTGVSTPGNGGGTSLSRAILRQVSPTTSFDTSGVSAGVKYLWRPETETTPAVAFGVQYVNVLKQRTAYVALSKSLTPERRLGAFQGGGIGVRGHLGARWDRIKASRSVTGTDESDLSFYGGVEAALSPRVLFMSEVGSRHDGLVRSPLSATLHFVVSENASLYGGVSRLGITRDTGWIVGFNYGFGRVE